MRYDKRGSRSVLSIWHVNFVFRAAATLTVFFFDTNKENK